ncbi:hypothetical protein HUB97_14185 [Halorubraceae archaeon YAN]|nr:hypothetical protein [Halorubraceae archaeon YAN]
MTEVTPCPVLGCSFEAPINEVITHVEGSSCVDHTWISLGYKNSDEFRIEAHHLVGKELEELGEKSRSVGNFETAIKSFERANWHYQQARLILPVHKLSLDNKYRDVLSTISEVEQEKQTQEVDDLLDEAELIAEEAYSTHLEVDPNLISNAYRHSIETLEQALMKAETDVPERIPEIKRRLQRVYLLQRSQKLSGGLREFRELVSLAREHASEGDRAFKQQNHEAALRKYTAASQCYESMGEFFHDFTFNEPTDDPTVCDVCHRQFEQELLYWTIELDSSLQVCPSCAQFGSEGVLPTPKETEEEHRIIIENIENISKGDIGVNWTSVPQQESSFSAERSDKNERNTQQMLIQLTGTVQQLGRIPTAEDLDEYTDFGFLEYRDEFGSIPDAVEEAGFELSK